MYDDLELDEGGGNRFLVGMLCGVAVGVALGVIFAPKPGKETRRQIAASSERVRRNASRTYHQAANNVTTFIARGRQVVTRSREAFTQTRQDATSDVSAVPTPLPEGPAPTI
jgi:gas vesicle protein